MIGRLSDSMMVASTQMELNEKDRIIEELKVQTPKATITVSREDRMREGASKCWLSKDPSCQERERTVTNTKKIEVYHNQDLNQEFYEQIDYEDYQKYLDVESEENNKYH